jgi:hypothetical protein
MRQTACVRRSPADMIGGGTWERAHARHEATELCGAARRRGGHLAGCGKGALGGDAGSQVHEFRLPAPPAGSSPFCGWSVRALSGQFIGAVVRCSYTATVTVSYGFKNESFGFVLGSGTAT